MELPFHILADGIPMQVIFGAVVFVLWGLGAILNKGARPPSHVRPSKDANELAGIRRRMLEEQARKKQAVIRAGLPKAKRKAQAVAREVTRGVPAALPPALPRPPSAITYSAAPAKRPAVQAPMASSKGRHRSSDTARNVRLLLQRNAAAEAFVLAEIFGPPKGLQ